MSRWRTGLITWLLCQMLVAEAATPATAALLPSETTPAITNATLALRSLADWQAACARLPSNRALRSSLVPKELLPLPRFRELGDVVTAFINQCKTGPMGNTQLWVGNSLPSGAGFFNTDTAYFLNPRAPTTPLIQSFINDTHRLAAAPTLTFQPFAQKVEMPAGAEIYIHADLHGDIRSLLADMSWLTEHKYLQDFAIIRPQFYLVFCGDYSDRGRYGVEVLYTLLRLKLANPDRVFLARGNHEEVSIASRYGFLSEGRVKYDAEFDPKMVLRAYDFLPVVIYLGTAGNFIQVHHGGMEPGFDPRPLIDASGTNRFQFIGALNQLQFFATHPELFPPSDEASRQSYARYGRDFTPEDPLTPAVLGFMWNDFSIVAEEPGFTVDPGRAFVYGQHVTQYLLAQTQTKTSGVRAVFRGHQQSSVINPMMRRLIASRGIFRHWQPHDTIGRLGAGVRELEGFLERAEERTIPTGSVWTLNISPDSVYGESCGYRFDTFGIFKTAATFADWRLRVVNVDISF
ncbi:MAG: serine/threonine protein phosphatase [Pedosphaera sp.]|nr:serine/threonine protein phosphatase [Pedosphaera sp.]